MITQPTTDAELQALCRLWQQRLNIAHWAIAIRFVRHWEMDYGSGGTVSFVKTKNAASIKVLNPADACPDWICKGDIELTVVHELVHVVLALVDKSEPSTTDDIVAEQAVHAISSALVNLTRSTVPRNPDSFQPNTGPDSLAVAL